MNKKLLIHKIYQENKSLTKAMQPAWSYRQFPSDFFDESKRKNLASHIKHRSIQEHWINQEKSRGQRAMGEVTDVNNLKSSIPKLKLNISARNHIKEEWSDRSRSIHKILTKASENKRMSSNKTRNQRSNMNYGASSLCNYRPFTDQCSRNKSDSECPSSFNTK